MNLPTILNKFQKEKRQKREYAGICKLWEDIQLNGTALFLEGEDVFLSQTPITWYDAKIPNSPGVYRVLDSDGRLIYIGESSDIKIRYNTHSNVTYFSALRRHIATDVLDLELLEKRRLTKQDNEYVDKYLSQCSIDYMPVQFGRYEFEKFLIKKHSPFLNKKDNK